MKKVYVLFYSAFLSAALSAQSLSPSAIATTGAYSSNGGNSMSYTIGEMTMVQTFTSANGATVLTQGFQQPTDDISGLLNISDGDFGAFAIYPNPTVDNLWFAFQLPEAGRVTVTMYDALGQKINDLYYNNYQSGTVTEQTNVSTLAVGVYLVSMSFTSATTGQTHLSTKKLQIIR